MITECSATKRYFEGTHRVLSPEVTLGRLTPLLSQMGITRVANVTGLDRVGIPVVMVCRPNGRSLAVFQGKGTTLEAAKVSGIMEAVERYHGEYPQVVVRNSTYPLMKRDNAIDVRTLPRIANSRLGSDVEIPWTVGRDVLNGEDVWLPLELASYRPTSPPMPGAGFFCSLSTGLAGGNSLLEATNHAVAEIIERDALTLWIYASRKTEIDARIDPATIDDQGCNTLIETLDAAGIECLIWNISSDVSVPTFLVHILERGDSPQLTNVIHRGSGTHPSREVALSRAITEAIQSRLTLISGARDDLTRDHYQIRTRHSVKEIRAAHGEFEPRQDFRDVVSFASDNLQEDLKWMLEKLNSIGVDRVIVTDLTRTDYQIPVARVVIPGMEDGDDLPKYTPGQRVKRYARLESQSYGTSYTGKIEHD